MNKEKNRITSGQFAEKTVIREEENRRIQFAAANPVKEVLKNLHTTDCGLDEEGVGPVWKQSGDSRKEKVFGQTYTGGVY